MDEKSARLHLLALCNVEELPTASSPGLHHPLGCPSGGTGVAAIGIHHVDITVVAIRSEPNMIFVLSCDQEAGEQSSAGLFDRLTWLLPSTFIRKVLSCHRGAKRKRYLFHPATSREKGPPLGCWSSDLGCCHPHSSRRFQDCHRGQT